MGRKLVTVVAIVGLSFGATCLASPARRPAVTKRLAPKLDPIAVLAGTVIVNSVGPDDDLHKFCATAKFQNLAYALQGAKSLAVTKTEFETQAQFDERTSKLTDAINGESRIAVCQYLEDNEDVGFSYDPEKEVFNVSFNPTLEAWRVAKKTGNYISKTRMGVRATVHSSIEIDYVADMSSYIHETRATCVSAGYTTVTFKVPVKQADAELLKLTGHLIIFGRVVPRIIANMIRRAPRRWTIRMTSPPAT